MNLLNCIKNKESALSLKLFSSSFICPIMNIGISIYSIDVNIVYVDI